MRDKNVPSSKSFPDPEDSDRAQEPAPGWESGAAATCPCHRWREDFPIRWGEDHYITRRELTKFLTLGSALLVCANSVIAFFGHRRKPGGGPAMRIASLSEVPAGSSHLFRYPTDEDPCILFARRTVG